VPKQLTVSVQESNGCPSFNADLGRVNVFLGINGSGKSKLLNDIAFQLRETSTGIAVVQTVGGRQIFLSSNVSGRVQTTNQQQEFEDLLQKQTLQSLQSIRRESVDEQLSMGERSTVLSPESRLQRALALLASQIAGFEKDYRERFFAWGETDRSTASPVREESQLLSKLLGLFTEIFPSIKISAVQTNNNQIQVAADHHSFKLECNKGGQTYPIDQMSDGEKQVFASLVDRFLFSDSQCVFVIDEPELNLDPVLACNFWNVMEREMPESTFLFATHSMDFAIRKGVDKIWVLGQSGPAELDREQLKNLSSEEQRSFLGSIRGIVLADIGVVVEGDENSIDAIVYPWLLDGNASEICVRSYGGCDSVVDATKKIDIWEEIAPSAKIIGIVDRDYRSDEEILKMEGTNCVLLKLHDLESYLCNPDLLESLAQKLQIKSFPSKVELTKQINQHFSEQVIATSARRMAHRCHVKRQISIKNDALSKIKSEAELIKTAKKYAASDQQNVSTETSVENVATVIREELTRCKESLRSDNLDDQFTLFRGKELLDELAKLFDFSNGKALAKYISNNLSPDDFPHLAALRAQILDRAGLERGTS